jgi:hypothetical protein
MKLPQLSKLWLSHCISIIGLIVLLITFTQQGHVLAASSWYVAPTGNDANDCLSSLTACQTIGTAIGKASTGDTLLIAAGNYTENLTIDKDLTLTGVSAINTTIDGSGTQRVLTITAGVVVNINDMMIRNGNANSDNGGGILSSGTLTLTHVMVISNTATSGGGIYIVTGTVTIQNSTIANNSSTLDGGGIWNGAQLALQNVTLGENAAMQTGGGLWNNGTAILTNVTVYSNTAIISASSLYNDGIGVAQLRNTLVASNGDNCSSLITSLGHNLDSGNSCGFNATGDLTNTNPLVSPLQYESSTTWIHALLQGSPAIDAGDDAACPATDQRSANRPADGDANTFAHCDIGAYELMMSLFPMGIPVDTFPDTNDDGIREVNYGAPYQLFGSKIGPGTFDWLA